MLNRWIEGGLLDELEEQGMGCIVFTALAQGLLTDRYLDGVPADSRAARDDSTIAGLEDDVLARVRHLNGIAERRGQKLAQLALQWVLRDERVTSAVIGASSVEQLDTNLDALDGPALTVVDKGTHTSYSACGIPYLMAGDVDSADDLVARSADAHRESGIDLRMSTEVVSADLAARTVATDGGEVLEWDELVVATGAPAVVPDWALRPDGTTYDGVGAVKTLDDGTEWIGRFEGVPDGAHVVVVGAGYVGVEVAEAALRKGFGVTVLTRTRGMSVLEEEMSERVNVGLVAAGVEMVLGAEVTGLELDGDRVTGVRWDGGTRDADLVVVAIGVRPATEFLSGAGLGLTDGGALRPDP